MELTSKLDDYGTPAWIGVMVLGFIVFWPLGLAILAYLIWSGRMGCWKRCGPGRWYHGNADHSRPGGERWRRAAQRAAKSSGNTAFDEYREETLHRLEEEQHEFEDFLERLRQAKDKAEFDQFMQERRRQADSPDSPEGPEFPQGSQPQPNA